METRELISHFFDSGNIAVIGATNNKNKFGNRAFLELKQKGFSMFPVNPGRESIEGEKCFDSVSKLPVNVDNALFVVQPQKGIEELKKIKSSGIKRVWLQSGSESEEILNFCKENSLEVISGKCVLMYAPPVKSFHKFHRAVWKLIGRL